MSIPDREPEGEIFIPTLNLSSETWERRTQLARNFRPLSLKCREIDDEIKNANKEPLTLSDRAATLVDIYLATEENGLVFGQERMRFTEVDKVEWVRIVNLALEITLREGRLGAGETFNHYRDLFEELLKKNRNLLKENPRNIFFGLGNALRGEMEKAGIKFPMSGWKMRRRIASHLSENPEVSKELAKGLKLPWVRADQNSNEPS